MDHQNYELVRERGSVRVAWICLGEGYNGDYDPKNPEDELLLRFDVAVKDDSIGDFVTTESRCTCFAASASAKGKEAALEILLNHFFYAYTKEPRCCIETLANKLCYISADTYRDLMLDTNQDMNNISPEYQQVQ